MLTDLQGVPEKREPRFSVRVNKLYYRRKLELRESVTLAVRMEHESLRTQRHLAQKIIKKAKCLFEPRST